MMRYYKKFRSLFSAVLISLMLITAVAAVDINPEQIPFPEEMKGMTDAVVYAASFNADGQMVSVKELQEGEALAVADADLRYLYFCVDKASYEPKMGALEYLSDLEVEPVGPFAYNGAPQEPEFEVSYRGQTLKKGTDYVVMFENNTDAGDAIAVIKGTGAYFGTTQVTFEIRKAEVDLKGAVVNSKVYDGTAIGTVKDVLFTSSVVKSTDYTAVAKFVDANVGDAKWVTVTVTLTEEGRKNLILGENGADEFTTGANITPAEVSEPTVKGTYLYTGEAQEVELEGFADFMTIVSGNKATDAGEYTVEITLDSNHKWAEGADGRIQWTIGKSDLAVTAPTAKTDLVYNGEEQALITAGTAQGGTMLYSLAENGTYTEAIPVGTDAGEYTVWYYVQGGSNHDDSAKASVTVTIAKAAPATTAPVAAKDLLYTGEALELILAGTSQDGMWQYKLEGGTYSADLPTAVDAGTYTVFYQLTGDSNHTDLAEASMTVIVGKAVSAVTDAPAAKDALCYTGEALELVTAGTAQGGTLVYSLTEDGTYTAEIPTAILAGDYTVYYKVEGNANYEGCAGGKVFVTIAKAEQEIAVTAADVTYSGEDYDQSNITVTGAKGDVTCGWYTDAACENAIAGGIIDAGTYYVKVSVTETENYQAASRIEAFTVAPKAVSIQSVAVADKTYDGTTDGATVTEVVFAGLIGTDTVEYTVVGAQYDDKNAGDAVKVTGSVALADSVTNYVLPEAAFETTGVIRKKAITVTMDDKSKVYGAENPAFTWKITEGALVTGDEENVITVAGYCAATTVTGVGSADITGSADARNYAVTVLPGTLTIEAKNLSDVTVEVLGEYEYTGRRVDRPTVRVTDNGKLLESGYTYTVTNNINAGEAVVTVTAMSGGNYTGEQQVTFVIAPKPVTIQAVTVADKTYDGTTDGAVVTAVIFDGLVGTDTVEYTAVNARYESKNAGDAVKVTGSVALADSVKNYVLKETAFETTGVIARKAITVTLDDQVKTYGEENPRITWSIADGMLAEGDDKAAITVTAAYEEGKTVNVGTAAITGTAEADNYEVTVLPGVLTVNAKSVAGLTVEEIADQSYTGSEVRPSVKVLDGTVELEEGTDYTVAYTDNTNAGTATVTITGKGNYDAQTSRTVQFRILSNDIGEMAVSGIADSYTYTGEEICPEITVGNLNAATDYDVAYENNRNVGTAKVIIIGKGNYTGKIEKTFVINKAASSVVTAPAAIDGLIYTGEAQALVTAGEAVGGTMVYSLTENGAYTEAVPTVVEPGDYTVWYYVKGDENHEDTGKASVAVTVGKAEQQIAVTIAPVAYSGEAYADSNILVEGAKGDVTRAYYSDAACQNAIQGEIVNAGTYYVKISAAETAQYQAAQQVKAFTIEPKAIAIIGAAVEAKAYNGKIDDAAITEVTFDGAQLIKDTDYTVSGVYAGPDAGEISVTVTVVVHNSNYALANNTFVTTGVINKLDNIQLTIAAADAVYTGAAYDQRNIQTNEGVSGEVTYTYYRDEACTEEVQPVNVGTYYAKGVIAGSANVNDAVAVDSFRITKAPLTVKANDHAITYGDAPANNGFGCVGFMPGDDNAVLQGEAVYTYSYKQYDDAGTYTITPAGLDAENYEITYETGVLTVAQKAVRLKWYAVKGTLYIAEAIDWWAEVYEEDLIRNDMLTVTVNNPGAISAGAHTVTATALEGESGTNADNYRIDPAYAEHKFDIAKATLNIQSVTVAEKTYNGKTDDAAITIVLKGLQGDDVLEAGVDYIISAAYETADAADEVKVTGTVTLTDTQLAKNYRLQKTAFETTGKVTKTVTTLELQAADAVYTGLPYDTDKITAESNVADPVTYTYYQNGQSLGAGIIPVNAGTYTVKGVIAANINTSAAEAEATFTIEKAPLTVAANAHTITYGAEPANSDVTYTGFVNGEDETVLNGELAYDYTYEQYGDVGVYAITPKGLTSNNYAITFVDGALTVERKEIGLSWSGNGELTYTGSAVNVTAAATGTVNNDAIAVAVEGGNAVNAGQHTATATGLTGEKAGNYKLPAEVSASYTIKAADMSAVTVEDIAAVTYSGVQQKPEVTLHYNGMTLTAADYTVAYGENVNVGTGTVTITGKGNYTGEVEKTFAIEKADSVIAQAPEAVSGLKYTGEAQELVNSGTVYGGKLLYSLQEDGEYTETVPAGVAAQAYTVWYYVQGDSNHEDSGKASVEVTIAKAQMSETVVSPIASVPYNGEQHKPGVEVTHNGKILIENQDYTVSYGENRNAGTGTVTITGKGNYEDTVTAEFEIVQTASSVTKPPKAVDLTYTGEPVALVTAGTAANGTMVYSLTENGEYTADIPAGTAAGSYTVYYKVVGDENHTDTAVQCVPVSIVCKVLEKNPELVVTIASKIYNGLSQLPDVTVTDGEKLLVENTDYTVYTTPKNDGTDLVGKYDVTITGIGNYAGTITFTEGFEITAKNIADADITVEITGIPEEGFVYDGTEHTATVVVKYTTGEELAVTNDYGVVYQNNTEVGTATLTISGVNNYTGEVTYTFIITAAQASVKTPPASVEGLVYDGQELKLITGGTAIGGTMVYSLDENGTYYTNIPTGVDAKTYTVWYYVQGDSNHEDSGKASVEVIIAKAAPTVTAPAAKTGLTYTGEAQELIIAGSSEHGQWQYKLGEGDYGVELPKTIAAGEYTISYKFLGDNNHGDIAEASMTVIVARKAVAEPAVQGAYTYNGNVQTAELTDVEGVQSVTGNQQTNAGTHSILITLDSNHQWAEGSDGSVAWIIAKAQAEITLSKDAISAVYGDTIDLNIATANFGTVTCNKQVADLANVGEYTVTYTVESTENYEGATKNITVIVAPRAVAEPSVKGTYTYTGQEQEVQLDGFAADFMTIVGENKATNAGEYTVEIELDGNHQWADSADGEIAWEIIKAKAEITVDTTPISVTYGEPVSIPAAITTFGEVICDKSAGDLVNADSYTITYTVEGTDNFDGDSETVSVTVNQKTVAEPTVKGDYTYTGQEQKVQLDGFDSGFMTIISGNTATDAGEYTVEIELDSNHNWAADSDGSVEWSIEMATPAVTAPTAKDGLIYNGNAQELVNEGSANGGTMYYKLGETGEWNEAIPAVADAGTYTVWYYVKGADNYNDSVPASVSVTVNPKEITIAAVTVAPKSYDGTSVANVTAVTFAGLAEGEILTLGEDFTVSAAYDSANAGTVNVTGTVTLKAENYVLVNGVFETTGTIAKKQLDVSGMSWNVPENVVYENQEYEAELNGTLPEGVAFALSGERGTNAGNYTAKAVFSLADGYDEANYEIVGEKELTADWEIAKANPGYTAPSNLTATYGDTLEEVELPEGFKWEKDLDTSVGNAGTNTFIAIYTPADTANYNTVEIAVSIAVAKAESSYEVPTGLIAQYGQTLADVALPEGFEWKDNSLSVGNAGDNIFTAIYTPKDTTNYNTADVEITVTVNRDIEDKFAVAFPHTEDYLYRVGNKNTVALSSLFTGDVSGASVEIEKQAGKVSGDYNESKGTIQFSGNGVVQVTIREEYATPLSLLLEVVDAYNVTTYTGGSYPLGNRNSVLLNDIAMPEGNTARFALNNATLYGNGFTFDVKGGMDSNNTGTMADNYTILLNGSSVDNIRIVGEVYKQFDFGTQKSYNFPVVLVQGNSSITNSYISNGGAPVRVNGAEVTITNTILKGGAFANIDIRSGIVTLTDVTTINQRTLNDKHTNGGTPLGFGIGFYNAPATTKLIINGTLTQHNCLQESDSDLMCNSTLMNTVTVMFNSFPAYQTTIDGTSWMNTGIATVNSSVTEQNIVDNRVGHGYSAGTTSSVILGETISVMLYSDLVEEEELNAAPKSFVAEQGAIPPTYSFAYPKKAGNPNYVAESGNDYCRYDNATGNIVISMDEGDTFNFDPYILTANKYESTLDYSIQMAGKTYDDVIPFKTAGNYIIEYIYSDSNNFMLSNGQIKTYSQEYAQYVYVTVRTVKSDWKDAIVAIVDPTVEGAGTHGKTSSAFDPDYHYCLPLLKNVTVTDFAEDGTEETVVLTDNIAFVELSSSLKLNSAGTVTIVYTDNRSLIINVNKKATGGIPGSYDVGLYQYDNTLWLCSASAKDDITEDSTWAITSYTFTGNNGHAVTDNSGKMYRLGSNSSVSWNNFKTYSATIKYTVSFNANGGTCSRLVGYSSDVSAVIDLPKATWDETHYFEGWYTAAEGGTLIGFAGDQYTPGSNITLYAQWTEDCTVTYDANGGIGEISSSEYAGTEVILPAATRDGYYFIGWYTAADGGEKAGNAGDSYKPWGATTLYAHWQEAIRYTVTYDANGGSCATASAIYEGTPLTLPTPTKTDGKFLGWYDAASGGIKIGNASDAYIPTANTTLYAQWESPYTISVSTSNANITGVINGQKAYYNDSISVTVKFTKNSSKSFNVKDASGNTLLSKSADGTYTFTMPASNITISASSSSSCVTPDTLVTLIDGTQKRIDKLEYTDELLVWDFVNGEYTGATASILVNHGASVMNVLALNFSNGSTVKTIDGHCFFDVEENKFVCLDVSNVADYVGHRFVQQDGDGYAETILESYSVTEEHTEIWSLLTAEHFNCIMEGMFSLTNAEVEGPEDYVMPFVVGEGMKYDAEAMAEDIETYGLYEYEDFEEYLTYEQFAALNLPIFKVSVGKGYITYNEILALLGIHVDNVNGIEETIEQPVPVAEYTIYFDTDGGSEIEPITLAYGAQVTMPEDPVKEGYTFLGWDEDIPEVMPEENLVFTALWQAVETQPEAPVEGEQQPPVEGEQQPPVEGEEQPPVEGEEQPPVEGEEQPPVEGEEQPPVEGEQQPPVEGEQQPPVEGEEQPPVEGEEQPPVEGEEQPPVEGEQQTPAEGEQTPAEGEEQPPVEGEEQPPVEEEAAEPAVDGTPEVTE